MDVVTPWWVNAFLGLYFFISFLLFLYGVHAYLMAFLYHRSRVAPPTPATPRDLPAVTVQLPLYNERYVAARLIEAVTHFDYPRDRLEIQVLDDSTDDTVQHVSEEVERWREAGWNITLLHRTDRRGFKGGALREGLVEATGELIAVFDADFMPPRDFLMRTVPHFQEPGIGLVQARWTHLNEDYSVLTRAQAVALDGHFIIEHTVRNRNGAFINFNGTAGIWRKQAILDAGNWQDDTLTEDLDLSYRAQLAGWTFRFLPDLECPAELPAEVNGLKGQQFRWAKGSVQTALKILPTLVRRPLPWFARLQAVIHLTNHSVYPLLLALGLCAFPALMLLDRYPGTAWMFRVATVLVVASFGHPWLYFVSQRARGKTWKEAAALIPLVLAGNMGIAINNTRALVEAMARRESPFIRTPKYALRARSDRWDEKRYHVPRTAWPLLELALAAYTLTAVVYAIGEGHLLAVPFLLLYVAGAGYIGAVSVLNGWVRIRRAATVPESWPPPDLGRTR